MQFYSFLLTNQISIYTHKWGGIIETNELNMTHVFYITHCDLYDSLRLI